MRGFVATPLRLLVLAALVVCACREGETESGEIVGGTAPLPSSHARDLPPTPEPVTGMLFAVNSRPLGCHESPDASAPVAARQETGTVLALDQVLRRPHRVWHRVAERNCWVRTDTGPVLTFEDRAEADRAATAFRTRPEVTFQGAGPTVTERFRLPAYFSVLTVRYDGAGRLGVRVLLPDSEQQLVTATGPYVGQFPLWGTAPLAVNVQASGPWSVRIQSIEHTDALEFSGTSDTVTDFFDPPASGRWRFVVEGRRPYGLFLHCSGPVTRIVQQGSGPSDLRLDVGFPPGPCFWQVSVGSGPESSWRLTPAP